MLFCRLPKRSAEPQNLMYFNYDHLEFRYEPYPMGLAKPLIEIKSRDFVPQPFRPDICQLQRFLVLA